MGHPHYLHPSQLYQSLIGFGAFALLLWLWPRRRFDGQIFWLYVLLEGVGRFLVDFSRYYEAEQIVAFGPVLLTQSQLLSLGIMVAGLLGLGIARRRAETVPT